MLPYLQGWKMWRKKFFNIIIKTKNNKKALYDLAINNKIDAFVLETMAFSPLIMMYW